MTLSPFGLGFIGPLRLHGHDSAGVQAIHFQDLLMTRPFPDDAREAEVAC
jgi:hypothetical protein